MKILDKNTLVEKTWNSGILNKYKLKFVEFFDKLKNQFKHNQQSRQILKDYINNGSITKEQAELLKQITVDNLKLVGLGSLAILPIPGGTLLMILLVNSAKKIGINLIPSQFESNSWTNELPETNEYVDFKTFDLQEAYDYINGDVFNNELPQIELGWKKSKNSLGRFSYDRYRVSKEIVNLQIKISTMYNLTKEKLMNILCHEMIHYWQLLKHPEERDHHGYWFRQKMQEINNTGKYKITIKDEDVKGLNLANDINIKEHVLFISERNFLIYKKQDLTYEIERRIKITGEYNNWNFKKYITTDPNIRILPTNRTKINYYSIIDKNRQVLNNILNSDKTVFINNI